MTACIFTGPTISAAEASRQLQATYLPPAAEGDIYRVALAKPRAIGIIDGYFQSVPAVRHKEILWAMSQGIHIFGSASIGALRAAELAAFGMVGIGRVFAFYREGILEDDDEVTVAHGTEETGFKPYSEAMVNIRQTLHKAMRIGVISKELQATLEKVAKATFYPERSYSNLLESARKAGVTEAALLPLRQWLPKGKVNQKRRDALAMLRFMRHQLAGNLKPKEVPFFFEHTVMWNTVLPQKNLTSSST